MKKYFPFFGSVVHALSLHAQSAAEDVDADSDLGTIGLVVISIILIAGIIALIWTKKEK